MNASIVLILALVSLATALPALPHAITTYSIHTPISSVAYGSHIAHPPAVHAVHAPVLLAHAPVAVSHVSHVQHVAAPLHISHGVPVLHSKVLAAPLLTHGKLLLK